MLPLSLQVRKSQLAMAQPARTEEGEVQLEEAGGADIHRVVDYNRRWSSKLIKTEMKELKKEAQFLQSETQDLIRKQSDQEAKKAVNIPPGLGLLYF
jgi:hypothetical protein